MSSTTDSWLKMDPLSEVSSWTHARELREKNKNLRRVYDEAQMHYGADVSNPEELAKRTAIAVKLRQCQVKTLLELMQTARNLDLCFLVDATYSMRSHIIGVKDSIHDIVNTLMNKPPEATETGSLQPHIAGVKDSIRDIVNTLATSTPGASGSLEPHIAGFKDSIRGIVSSTLKSGARDATELEPHIDGLKHSFLAIVNSLATSAPGSHGSLEPHIAGVKDSGRAIVNTLTNNTAFSAKTAIVKKIRLAFVAYRDFGNDPQFEVLDFTDSVDAFQEFCASISTKQNNDDEAEDVFGGLEKVNELKWTTDGSTRVLFHIADNPCHGNGFHNFPKDPELDRYPDGDPKGRSIDSLLGQLSAKNIDYFFGKITDNTDKMLDKFSAIYEDGILQCDIKNPEKICSSVVEMSSFAVVRAGSSVRRCRENLYKGPFATAEPDWELLPVQNGRLFSFELPKSIEAIIAGKALTKKQPTKAKLKLAELPFGKGAERVAFYGRDVTDPDNPQDIVMKKYTCSTGFIVEGSKYEAAIQMQTIAAYMASVFTNQLMEKVGHGSAIEFLKSQIFYEGGNSVFPANCKFLRFTNNVNYTMFEQMAKQNGVDVEFVRQMIAFSHWTYQVTKGTLMIVDLQGIINTEEKTIELTDPAIHCTDVTRFSRTNLGLAGMKSFFDCHECNDICKKMGLTFPVELVKVAVADE